MAKSKARFLSELLGDTGLVKKSKSALAGADEVLDLDTIPTIPNSKLQNSTISIAGHSTALGGSVTLNTGNIVEHTDYRYFTDARARGAVSVSGDLAYNSSTGVFSFTERTDAEVRGLVSATGSLSYNSTTGVMSFTMPAQNTSNVTEGTNLYFTNARARSAISATGSLSYNSTTGVMSFTMPAQNTSNVTEGTNLYYTNARADARIAAASTSDLSEGTNLYYTDARADARVALIVDSAPGTLNTLNELAAALGDDANFSTTVTNSIAAKLPLAGGALTGNLTIDYSGNTTNDAGLYLANDNSDWGIYVNKDGTGTYGIKIAAEGEYPFQITNSSGIEKFRVNNSGNVILAGTVDGRDVATDGAKLDGIETGATADQTAAEILTAIKTVDGSGSGLDADLLDGLNSTAFIRSDTGTIPAARMPTVLPTSGNYVWSNSTTAGSYPGPGLQCAFVRAADGWPEYGSVLHVGGRGGSDAGGDFQIFAGHGSANGGNYLRFRNADNNASPSDAWTAWKTIWGSGNDGSGSGLDADNLDGVTWGSYKSTGHTMLNVQAGDGNGLRFWNGSSDYQIVMASQQTGYARQAYEPNSDYNMYFRMSGGTNRGFVFQNGTSSKVGIDSLGNIRANGVISSNNRQAMNCAHWSASGTTTGAVKITLPGSAGSVFSMPIIKIYTYQYNSTAHVVYTISGHDWSTASNWYNARVTAEGGPPLAVRLGHDGTNYCIIIGETNTSWSYGSATVELKAHPSYYAANQNFTTGWTATQITSMPSTVTAQTVGKIWDSSNDGSGSGLDADLLDGQQPSALSVNYANTAGSAPASGGTATALNGSNYITRRGGTGNYNTDFTNVPAGAMNHQGDDASSTNNPGGTWWFLDNYRHSNSGNYWGTQVAWGWEDNANTLRQRNVTGGNWSGWVSYWNSGNDGSGSGLDADLLDGQHGSYYFSAANYPERTNFENGYNNLSTSTGASANLNTVFQNSRSGFIDCWSGTNFPSGATHVQGIQARHQTGNHYGFQLVNQYNQQQMWHRQVTNNSFGAWNRIWSSSTDGSGSGLDADLLDGIDSSAIVYGANGYGSSNVGFASLTNAKSGFYDVSSSGTPTSTWYSLVNMAHYGSNHGHQIAGSFYSAGDLYNRYNNNTNLGAWTKIWNTANDGAGSGLDADLLDGQQGSYYLPKVGGTTSGTITLGTQYALVANSYGRGLFGIYSSYRYQHVWSMGTAYKTSDDGTSYGNMYGLTYTHTNVGTGTNQSISGLSHQLQGRANGTLWWSLGNGIWTVGNITAYSDIAVKTNLVRIPNALEKVCSINGYTYERTDYVKDPEDKEAPDVLRQAGVVAQEIEKVLPEVVSGKEGNKAVAYGNIVALLIESIKELKDEVDELKKQLKEK